MSAALGRDLLRNLERSEGLSLAEAGAAMVDALGSAAVSAFFFGIWLGQLGFAKFPDAHERRRRGGGEGADPSGLGAQ